MTEHHARIEISRPPAEVFAFLANPMNLPRWQPMLRETFREGPDRIRVIGGGVGAEGIAAHVRFAVEAGARCVSWATATGVGCAGDVRVEEAEAGAAVVLALRLGQRAARPEALAHWTGDKALDVDGALRASLVAVKQHCEEVTQGVTLVSGGTQAHPDQAALRDSRPYGSSATQNPGTG
ncbi:SRPBCC family protein [Falsiroseomonas oryzae]|uniref:SRPBCC family protein n=1 Tax=Falsiroseomonas oryzae TaxID=2766473 RepID=UPI0022EA290E|nr:SRPBCC family protein [Roseomonas sp. MO-31]